MQEMQEMQEMHAIIEWKGCSKLRFVVQLEKTHEVVGTAGDDQFPIRRQVDVRRAAHVFPNS